MLQSSTLFHFTSYETHFITFSYISQYGTYMEKERNVLRC